jgi:hypothetical protein
VATLIRLNPRYYFTHIFRLQTGSDRDQGTPRSRNAAR